MCRFCMVAYSSTAVGMGVMGGVTPISELVSITTESPVMKILQLQSLPESMAKITQPEIKEPQWLAAQKAAEAASEATGLKKGQKVVVTYDVTTKGVVTANLAEFKQQANATLNDQRGWARVGATFQEVASGGQFTLVLSEASQLPTFSEGCGEYYSCNAGRFVIINQDRWLGATDPWNNAGGSLRDYRHMVVNHETGHWLGHGHEFCGGAGQAAPVMQQQSISLQGCTFNPWPLASELWSTRLGIRQ